MATKQLTIEGIGLVTIYKRKGVKYLRLSIDGSGGVRITMPRWLPYRSAIDFLHNKQSWIQEHAQTQKRLVHQQRVGKAHILEFTSAAVDKPTVRLVGHAIRVQLPLDMRIESSDAQKTAERGVHRALKKEAEQLLARRLHDLAAQHGFSYTSLKIKRLKSRWGSCNNKKEIVLNAYLIQLPWHLIDYVILHELTHTRVLAHGKPFWDEMRQYVPKLNEVKKEMKLHQAQIV